MPENAFPPASNLPPAAAQPPQRGAGNGFGIASLILGIVTMVGFAIPFLNFAAIATGVVGVVLGVIGLIVKFRPRKAAVAGVILSGLGLILSIILVAVYAAAFTGAVKALSDDSLLPSSQPTSSASANSEPSTAESSVPVDAHAVTYDVTGDGTKATSVSYLTVNHGSAGTSQAMGAKIPFHKVIAIEDDNIFETSVFSLVAQAGNGSTITCKITVDGKVVSTNTSTGQYSVATCSGTN